MLHIYHFCIHSKYLAYLCKTRLRAHVISILKGFISVGQIISMLKTINVIIEILKTYWTQINTFDDPDNIITWKLYMYDTMNTLNAINA